MSGPSTPLQTQCHADGDYDPEHKQPGSVSDSDSMPGMDDIGVVPTPESLVADTVAGVDDIAVAMDGLNVGPEPGDDVLVSYNPCYWDDLFIHRIGPVGHTHHSIDRAHRNVRDWGRPAIRGRRVAADIMNYDSDDILPDLVTPSTSASDTD
jgi:hypothetical protein